jgi:hypothetical protein
MGKDDLITKAKSIETDARKSKVIEIPETEQFEIQKQATENNPSKKIRFPKKTSERYKLMPEEFAEVQNAIEAVQAENRQTKVYADSIESCVGYGSLIRILGEYFGRQVIYYRSEQGGSLSLEEAREKVYRKNINEEEVTKLLNNLLSIPIDRIGFADLLELHGDSPASAANLWEMIKREAQNEFESGHRAADVFEPADYMCDAWNRASYLGLRESLCEEWQPQGGIELTMIDAIAQSWLQLQFWIKESVKRSTTEPRQEDYDFHKWKEWNRKIDAKQWGHGHWDIPFVSEQSAVEHAAQMADRWQRMYFRAIRSLRDWRRYTPQVTINNPNQVNIAADGGRQVNISNTDDDGEKKITS